MDHSLEHTFKEFLADKAVTSHAHFEKFIDWVLTLFKIVFPFLAISILSRWSSHDGNGDTSTVNQQLQLAATRRVASEEADLAAQFDDAGTIIGGGRQDVQLLLSRGNSGLKPSSSSHFRRVRGSESPVAGPSTPTEGSGMLDFAQRGASNLGKQHAIYAKTY